MSRPHVTPRQAAILGFVRDYVESHGYSPPVREIGRRFQIASHRRVVTYLLCLEHKGLICCVSGKPRIYLPLT